MRYISTKGACAPVSFKEAVLTGLPPDRGLYFPERIPTLPAAFIRSLPDMTFREISLTVAEALLEEDIPHAVLKRMVDDTLRFDAPLVPLEPGVEVLELFHGPTLAFKDFGARFLARVMAYFIEGESREVTVLVATSGDTGSAVASGFFQVPGIRVVILYPSGKVSKIQEKQLTTHGGNITALEIEGTFDDCQRLVKSAFSDKDFEKSRRTLTSANSINIARLIPQSFYYFYAFSRLGELKRPVVFSVPCGNFGNITGGILAKRMGLPIDRFIAATNANDVFPQFLRTGVYRPEPSKQTLSNAMDVGDPSNLARLLHIYHDDLKTLKKEIRSWSVTDRETKTLIKKIHDETGYILDPHGAVAVAGMHRYLEEEPEFGRGVVLETAHPAKFLDIVEPILDCRVPIPERLQAALEKEKESLRLSNRYEEFKQFLMAHHS